MAVDSATAKTFTVHLPASVGAAQISLSFVNDYAGPAGDRNVWISGLQTAPALPGPRYRNGFEAASDLSAANSTHHPRTLVELGIPVSYAAELEATFRAMGANPISINWSETLTALQQGTVDGQENPVVSIIIPYKLWEMNKYITIWHYTIDPLILGVSKITWDSFDAKDKEIVAQAAREAMAWNKAEARKGLAGSTEAIDTLKSKGMNVVVLTDKEREVFKAKTSSVYEKWTKEIGAKLVEDSDKIVKGSSK